MDNFMQYLSPEALSSIPIIGGMAAWVGRTATKVGRNADDIAEFKGAFMDHMEEDRKAHEALARVEERVKSIHNSLARIERALEKA